LRRRQREASVPLAWRLAAIVWFNASGMACFKRYAQVLLPLRLSRWRLAYSRWGYWRAELGPLVEALAQRLCIKRGFNGLAFVDATALPVCAIQRERDHKSHAAYASKGMGSLGWFYGLKLHCVLSQDGELLRYWLSTGRTHDTQPLFDENFLRGLRGCLVGDCGYRVSPQRRAALAKPEDLVLIARPAGVADEQLPWPLRSLFRARWRIETAFGELKEHLGLCLVGRCKRLSTLQATVAGALLMYTLNRRAQDA
jgi:hypothetical protein